jgi:hypothetical protein
MYGIINHKVNRSREIKEVKGMKKTFEQYMKECNEDINDLSREARIFLKTLKRIEGKEVTIYIFTIGLSLNITFPEGWKMDKYNGIEINLYYKNSEGEVVKDIQFFPAYVEEVDLNNNNFMSLSNIAFNFSNDMSIELDY